MARAKPELINALRQAATKMEQSSMYQWGHMGSCNCGFLVQEVTNLSKGEIHDYAMRTKGGDWSEQTLDFCPESGYLMDQVISIMINTGMDIQDFKYLERLSDKAVLSRFHDNGKSLRNNKKEDVISYMRAWADLLEEKLLQSIDISELSDKEKAQLHLSNVVEEV